MDFFKVTTKCGHVGRGQYYEAKFFVKAANKKDAAAIARKIPRVKRDHKDAILDVMKISYADYKLGQALQYANPYFSCRNIQDQRLCLSDITESIFRERQQMGGKRRNQEDRLAKLIALRKLRRKQNKHTNNDYYMGA